MNQDYEIEVEHKDVFYLIYADLYKEGAFKDIPQTHDDPGGYDIITDPKFYRFVMYRPDDEPISMNTFEALKKEATKILVQVYWDNIFN